MPDIMEGILVFRIRVSQPDYQFDFGHRLLL